MAYFELYRLTRETAEGRLKRTLTGDAASGELAVLVALNSARVRVVREMVDGDPTLGDDFRSFILDHLCRATARAGAIKHWTVPIPMPVWDAYAAEARRNGMRIGEVLAAALENNLVHRSQAQDPIERIETQVKAYQATTTELISRLERAVERFEPAPAVVLAGTRRS